MRFGINLHNYGPHATPASIVRTACRADELGYDSLWTSDHVLVPQELPEPFGHLYETFATLSHLAGITDRIELGTSVLVLPQREPILVAKQAATINALSGGRLTLGVGVGWMEREYDYLGADFKRRGKTNDAYLDVLRTLWEADGPVDFHGTGIDVAGALFSPGPGHGPKIVIGGAGQPAFRRIARTGDGWHAIDLTPEQIQEGIAAINAHGPKRSIEISLRIGLALDRPRQEGPGTVLEGSAEQITEQVHAFRDAGVEHLIIDPQAPDPEQNLDDLERFAAEVRDKV